MMCLDYSCYRSRQTSAMVPTLSHHIAFVELVAKFDISCMISMYILKIRVSNILTIGKNDVYAVWQYSSLNGKGANGHISQISNHWPSEFVRGTLIDILYFPILSCWTLRLPEAPFITRVTLIPAGISNLIPQFIMDVISYPCWH